MTNISDLRREVENIMKIKGEVIGTSILENINFVQKRDGREALEKIEEFLEKINFPIKLNQIKHKKFYPIYFDGIIMLAIYKLLNYDDQKLQEMGRANAKFNIFIRIFMKYLVSFDRLSKEIPKMWKSYYTVGDLYAPEYSREKKYFILRLENFTPLPKHCEILKGYFSAMAEIIVKTSVKCEEIKCPIRGDDYHEFKLTW